MSTETPVKDPTAASKPAAKPASKTYTGSCHCGAFKYSCTFDLTSPTAELTKCNCSMCQKGGPLLLKPVDFQILSEGGTDVLTNYGFNSKSVKHLFCTMCGVRPVMLGAFEFEGKKMDFVRVNALTLDACEDGSEVDLRKVKVKYYNGKNFTGKDTKAGDEPFAGGCW